MTLLHQAMVSIPASIPNSPPNRANYHAPPDIPDIEHRAEAPAAASRSAEAPGTAAVENGSQRRTGVLRKMRYVWNNYRTVRIVTGLMATYAAHMTLTLIPRIAKDPKGLRDNPKGFLVDGWLKFADEANLMTVDRAHNAVLEAFAPYANQSACNNPVIKFSSNIREDNIAWYTPPADNAPAIIEFRTYLPNLAVTSAHEYLHCYTNPAFAKRIDDALGPMDGRGIREGLTEVLARSLGLPTPDPLEFKSIYPKQVKAAEAILKDIGKDAVARAMLRGDVDAIDKIIDAARRQTA